MLVTHFAHAIGHLRLAGILGMLLACASLAFGQTATLNGAGASFPYPLYAKWIDVYKGVNTRVNINYQSIGSGGGIRQLQAKTVDFGASDAPLTADEAKAMKGSVVILPMAAGSVALVYNVPGIPDGLRLTPELLSGIYLGEIIIWNDARIAKINPSIKLPARAIAVIHRADGSGTTFIFTDYLSQISKTWAQKVGTGKSVNWPVGLGGKGSEGVTGLIKNTPGAIGYVEFAYARQNKLSTAALQNRAGEFVKPGLTATTRAAAAALEALKKDIGASVVNPGTRGAYPISGLTYIMLYTEQEDAVKGKALVDYLWWAIRDGQQYAEALQYSPLPKELVALNEAALKSVTSGGKPLRP